jgi:hypothetical protein
MVAGDVNGDGTQDLIVSAPLFDTSNTLRDVGECYVFQGVMSIMGTPAANATVRGPLSSPAYYGTSLALGDVDGDGLNDIIAGAPGAEVANQAGAGRVFILLSGVTFMGVLNSTIALQAPDPQINGSFGQAVAAADLNQDGLADIIVGAPGEMVGGMANAGQVYIFLSNAPTVPLIVNH